MRWRTVKFGVLYAAEVGTYIRGMFPLSSLVSNRDGRYYATRPGWYYCYANKRLVGKRKTLKGAKALLEARKVGVTQ